MNYMSIKPKKLQPGDTVAIVSPSWGGPSMFPHIYKNGLKALEELGLKVKEYPSAQKDADFLEDNPEFRANDINYAFLDSDVKAIIASIGGNDSIRILPFLDIETIKNNPKIIMGYSDTTTLLTYLNQLGLVTLHGPSIMAGLSQYDSLGEDFHNHIKTLLFDNPEIYNYQPYKSYIDGYPDWNNQANTGKVNEAADNSGWNWLQGNSVVQGKLFGGNIEVMEFLKSTKFYPDEDFWNKKIFFLETSEEKPTPDQVKYMLRNYGMQGIFDKISALLIGRPKEYSDTEKKDLDEVVLKIVKHEFGNQNLPIITNMDFGHTDPQWILPLGINAEVDCNKKEFKLTEQIFAD
ncbi:LD-carboxypeptidase [Patescibacteria group bacterium]|nr:LD-carboxypeptidase [Patescibacteria group bacterium]